LSAAPGGVTAATPRLIASIAEGERASALVNPDIDSGGENIFGCGLELEQPAKMISEIDRAMRQSVDGESKERSLIEDADRKFPISSRFTFALSSFFCDRPRSAY
jgi:hypothetical protein